MSALPDRTASTQALLDEAAEDSIPALRGRIEHLDNSIRMYQQQVAGRLNDLKTLQTENQRELATILIRVKPPFLVANISEILRLENSSEAEQIYQKSNAKSAVIKTSHRDSIFLPLTGLVPESDLTPGDIVAVNRDTYTIYEKLPRTYDSRARAMEIDSKPTESYEALGGLEKQIQELKEAVVIPLLQPERLKKLGIPSPKGVLLHGPPGTGKTLLARACAAATNATFLRLGGPSLVQMYSGDGAAIVRDAFDLARSKSPTIVFIDEIDAVGGKRSDAENGDGTREVSRTMLELLNQLDGFTPLENVKVICATNRPDTLDPALVRSGRLDRKIELPMPNEAARIEILKIHAAKLKTSDHVNLAEIARMTEDFNGAMLKAVCVEAGMLALRGKADEVSHENFVDGILQVQSKKKTFLDYFS
jgi:26S proteasome regulatory subunit T5